jgi:ankyrin repeat protein
MTAARTGKVEALRTLAQHGANVNAKEQWLGETALMWAANEGHAAAVTELLKLGADPNARSTQMSFPKASPAVENLITMTFPQGAFTPLMYAARQGAMDATRALVTGGADLNAVNPGRRHGGGAGHHQRALRPGGGAAGRGGEPQPPRRGRDERALRGHRHADAVVAPGPARTQAVR